MITIVGMGLLEHPLIKVQTRVRRRVLVLKKELSKEYREVFGEGLSFLVDLLLLHLVRLPDYLHLPPPSHYAEVDKQPPPKPFLKRLLPISRETVTTFRQILVFLKIHHHTITIPESSQAMSHLFLQIRLSVSVIPELLDLRERRLDRTRMMSGDRLQMRHCED